MKDTYHDIPQWYRTMICKINWYVSRDPARRLWKTLFPTTHCNHQNWFIIDDYLTSINDGESGNRPAEHCGLYPPKGRSKDPLQRIKDFMCEKDYVFRYLNGHMGRKYNDKTAQIKWYIQNKPYRQHRINFLEQTKNNYMSDMKQIRAYYLYLKKKLNEQITLAVIQVNFNSFY